MHGTFSLTVIQTFIVATAKVLRAEVPFVYQIIPIIDCFNKLFTDAIVDQSLPAIIHHAAKLASSMLNKYYSLTDESEVYCIAMGEPHNFYLFIQLIYL
jgi:hypothetical protein